MNKKLPPRLYNELIGGLQMLLALRLSGSPAADTVAAMATAWEVALTAGRKWNEQEDAGRFQTAFATLAGTIRYWPAPRDMLDVLPPPAEKLKLEHRYLRTEAEKVAGLKNLQAIQRRVNSILNRKKTQPTKGS